MQSVDNLNHLIVPIKNDDAKAFEELFGLLYKPLSQHIFRLSGQRELSEELAQDIFISFWKNRKEVQITTSLKAYFFRAGTNKAYDYFRKKEHAIKQDELKEVNAYAESNTDDRILLSEMEKKVIDCLKSLPQRCREIFSLSRFSDYRNREIAGELNVALKTVENQINKGLKLMRDCVFGIKSEKA